MGNGWVGVDFNQPQFEHLVYHEIHAEQLKIEHFILSLLFHCFLLQSRQQNMVTGFNDLNASLLHLFLQFGPDRSLPSLPVVLIVNEPTKQRLRYFVSFLEFAIIMGQTLNGIVGEVDKTICRLQIEGSTACPNVALIIAVYSQLFIEKGDKHVAADIKFPMMIEQWYYILLKNQTLLICCFFASILQIQPFVYFFKSTFLTLRNDNSFAPIRIFPRFNDPKHLFLTTTLNIPQNRTIKITYQIAFRYTIKNINLIDREIDGQICQKILFICYAFIMGEMIVNQDVVVYCQILTVS